MIKNKTCQRADVPKFRINGYLEQLAKAILIAISTLTVALMVI